MTQAACEQRRLCSVDGDEAQALAEAEEVLGMLQFERLDRQRNPFVPMNGNGTKTRR